MRLRRTDDSRPKLTVRDVGIEALLDLFVGAPMPGQPHRHYSERCRCQNSFSSYRALLSTYRQIRDELRERQTGNRRSERPDFAELLHRVARRWPRRDIEAVGAAVWQRRNGDSGWRLIVKAGYRDTNSENNDER